MLQGRTVHTEWGGLLYIANDGKVTVLRRDFGLTWQGLSASGECSREMHVQIYTYFHGVPPPPDMYLNDPPSVTQPPVQPIPPPPVPTP